MGVNINSVGPTISAAVLDQNFLNLQTAIQNLQTDDTTHSTQISAQQAQINTTQATANSASTTITNHIAQATGAHAASAISETRLGDAQTALTDLNTRVTNIVGQSGTSNTEIVDARQSTPENSTFAVLKDRLDTSDNIQAIIDQARADITRESIDSGVYRFSAITAGNTATPNAFAIAQEEANVNGQRLNLGTPTIQLSAPPSANVTPALPGSARDDLIFLEMWKQWVAPGGTLYTNGNVNGTTSVATYGQYQWQWRQREVDGVDFSTYPEGLSASNVFAQGARGTVGTLVFTKSSTDSGLYVASDATGGPIDGVVYAIPLFRVRRRNTTAYNVDTNPFGGREFDSTTQFSATQLNQGAVVTFNSTITGQYTIGEVLRTNDFQGNLWALWGVTAVTSTQVTCSILLGHVSGSYAIFRLSDRPDGLYSNIIDASDLHGGDLRHQVSPTGFNMHALLEKNLDLNLRMQLFTSLPETYTRDYIGLNLTAYTDDVNTLLFCNFDGSINGTANGVAVTGTATGTTSFVNGVQGEAVNLVGYSDISYPVTIAANSPFTIETLFKAAQPSDTSNYGSIFNSTAFDFYVGGGQLKLNVGATSYPIGSPIFKVGDWVYAKLEYTGSGNWAIEINDTAYTLSNVSTPSTITDVAIGNTIGTNIGECYDLLRVSNIVRTGTPFPTGFSDAQGDRILDGPDADFNYWSDDMGGITGVNGRTNPYGLTHVPNQVEARVNYNGSEVRHYLGQGITPGASEYTGGIITVPIGAMDNSGEMWANISANEVADGTRVAFTFTVPSYNIGLIALYEPWISSQLYVNSVNVTVSSASIEANTITVVLANPPTSGVFIGLNMMSVARHAHFVPSTKGFMLHDWTDDTFSNVNGTTTVFQTTKYNATSVNYVGVTPSASTIRTIQNGGYTVTGLNARTTLSASAASGAVTLAFTSGANFVNGQNIRIQKGDGTWYTTTVSSGGGTSTITVPATTVALAPNAVVEGAAVVTFTAAPASGSAVDIVYESVITPSEGDYLRIAYQHTPYQGVMSQLDATVYPVLVHLSPKVYVTTYGTGKYTASSGVTGIGNYYSNPLTVSLPTPFPDYLMKADVLSSVMGATNSDYQAQFRNFPMEPNGFPTNPTFEQDIAGTFVIALAPQIRGTQGGTPFQVGTFLLNTAVPHLAFVAALVQLGGELYLWVLTDYSSSTDCSIYAGSGSSDLFKLQGRPLIKNYGGVTN